MIAAINPNRKSQRLLFQWATPLLTLPLGDEEEQERLVSICEDFKPDVVWLNHSKDLNVVLSKIRTMPPPDLHNIYQGQVDAWQLHETVDDFIQRLPPRSTSVALCPWIWVANPFPDGRDRSGRPMVQDELIPRGRALLQQSLQERNNIRNRNPQEFKGTVTRFLNQESDSLKQRLTRLAEETNVLSGKVRTLSFDALLLSNGNSGCFSLAWTTSHGSGN